MPEIDHVVAYHQLAVSPSDSVVTQRRRKQFPEKEQAAKKDVKDLKEASFIFEVKYTT